MGDSPVIGLLGGSFDPPHMGHVLLCAVGLAGMGLDEVWLVPCRCHPFGKPLSPFEKRTRLCKLAVGPLGERVRVETIESELGPPDQPSFTIETVEALRDRYPDTVFRLLMGSDAAREMEQWREPERLAALAEPLIVPRMEFGVEQVAEGPQTLPAISSSSVRDRIAEGLSVEGWIPPAVEAQIRSWRLYAAP